MAKRKEMDPHALQDIMDELDLLDHPERAKNKPEPEKPGEREVHRKHRERVRNRFDESGIQGFASHEVLELLLFYVYPQGDVNPIAHRLIDRFGSFYRVLEASPEQLMTVQGIGEQAARLLHLVFQIGMRYHQDGLAYRSKNTKLDSTEKMAHFFAARFSGLPVEVTAIACVDASLRPICCELVSRGAPTASELLVHRIAQSAVRNHAPAVILMHNHPRGKAEASSEDCHATRELRCALESLGVQLIDHIVLGETEYASMRDYGMFEITFV